MEVAAAAESSAYGGSSQDLFKVNVTSVFTFCLNLVGPVDCKL